MRDFEERLRAALGSVAEQAPPGLMDAIRRRHRRRAMRLGAGAAALVVAVGVAVPAAADALRGHGGSRVGPPTGPGLIARVHAAPGTVLSDCQKGPVNLGALGSNWRSSDMYAHAGPVWFLGGGFGHGRLSLWVAIVVLSRMKSGSTVVVKVAPAGRAYLRFLYGPADTLNAGTRYTMRSGEAGVTFEACNNHGPVPTPGITDYYGGFLVRGARCVPVRVWVPGRQRPYHIRLGACSGH